MKTFSIFLFIFIILVQIFHSLNGLAIREPFSASNLHLKYSSIPVAVRQLAFNVDTASGQGPSNILLTSTSGGLSTFGEAGLNLLRRGTLSIADALVNVLGGIATLINMIQNYARTGSAQFNNISSSSQGLTNRLIDMGTNAATTIMNTLSNEFSTSGSNGVGSPSGLNPAISPPSQFIVSESTPITQTQVDSGRQSTLAWPQASVTRFPISSTNSNSPGISAQSASVSASQPQIGGRVGPSLERPLVSVTSTSGANNGDGAGNLNGAGVSGFGGSSGTPGWGGSSSMFGWGGQGRVSGPGNAGSALGWGNSRVSGNTLGWGTPGGTTIWGGSGGGVASSTAGWGGTNAPGNTFGWGIPGGTVGRVGPGEVGIWGGPNGGFGSGGAGNMAGWGGTSASGNTFGWGIPGGTVGRVGPGGVGLWGGSSGGFGSGDAGNTAGWGGTGASGNTFSWSGPGNVVGWRGPNGVASWGGSSGSVGSGDVGGIAGWGSSSASDSTLGWGVPSGTISWGGTSGLSGSGGVAGMSSLSGLGGVSGTSGSSGVDAWDSSNGTDSDVDGWDVLNGITMYGASSSNNSTNAISPLSTWIQTLFSPLETFVNATTEVTEQSPGSLSTESSTNTSTNPAPTS